MAAIVQHLCWGSGSCDRISAIYLSTHSGSVANSVRVVALALISLLLETEQATKPWGWT